MTTALQAIRLTKRFAGLVAVQAVDLNVRLGSIHGLIGPNGAGKTTVFNLLSGLLRPTSGNIYLFGEDVTGLTAYRRARRGLGRLFQVPQLFPSLTVEQHLQLVASSVRIEHISWVERLGLAQWLPYLPPALPFGIRRKVELALVVLTEPQVLLLDEPAAGLGVAEKAELKGWLRELSRRQGKTILLVEHDMEWTLDVVDHLTVMAGGRIIADGEPGTVCALSAVQEAYLGSALAHSDQKAEDATC